MIPQKARIDGQVVDGMALTYPPTLPEEVCFDGWRPEGTLPGDTEVSRCPECGILYVSGTRHFSVCAAHPGTIALDSSSD